MLKVFLMMAMVTIFGSFFLQPALAESQPANEAAVSAKDAQNVREAAKFLGAAFDVKVKNESLKQEAQPADSKEESKKTIADVADKGLDMIKNFVVALSSTLEKMAPKVWTVMVRQQYAKAWSLLVVPWGIFIITLIYRSAVLKVWQLPATSTKDDRDVHDILTGIIPFIACLITAIWGVINLKDTVLLFMNPEYYAIQDLLRMILQ
jgi:hypothetical protein